MTVGATFVNKQQGGLERDTLHPVMKAQCVKKSKIVREGWSPCGVTGECCTRTTVQSCSLCTTNFVTLMARL